MSETCTHCGAEVTNGLALCERCRTTLSNALVNVAAYYADVERIQPGQRVKVRSAYQSTPPPAVKAAHDPISAALAATAVMVFGWCQALADDRPAGTIPSSTGTRIGWLESHIASIATLAWAVELLRDSLAAEHSLKRILDHADTGWYAGVCRNEIGREEVDGRSVEVLCERGLYGNGSPWVTCPECGRCWNADERREDMRKAAEDEKAPVRVLAAVVVGLEESELSVERLTRRIEKWIDRGQLHDYGVRVLIPGQKPRRVYRIGDVLALVRGEVRPKDAEAC